MIVRRVLSAVLLALAVEVSAASAQSSEGMKPVAIGDPVLQMTAWTLRVPASWNAEGTMLPGTPCNGATSPVYRAASADGRIGVYLLPRFDWSWGTGVRSSGSCLPWNHVVGAKDFLSYLTRIEKVGFVRDLPVPELAGFRQAVLGQMHGQGTADMARYLVHYSVNGQPVEEILTANVSCGRVQLLGGVDYQQCRAFATRWFAPEGQALALIPTFKSLNMTLNQQWMSAWTFAMQDRANRLYAAQTQRMLQQGALFESGLMRSHQDFMASFEQARDVRNARFAASQYQKQYRNDNFVDYILDCQRAYGSAGRVSSGNCPNRQTY